MPVKFIKQKYLLEPLQNIYKIFLKHYFSAILPVDTSYQIAAVSAFLAAKYALGLIVTTIHLGNDLRENMSAYHS